MDEKIAVFIVRAIIRDIYGRYGMEQYFRSTEPRLLMKIYEEWIRVVSVQLEKAGVVEKVYEPLKVDEMSFVDVINRSDYYLKNEDELG
ncbi:hypothetical protein ACIQXR_04700 [Peribacillus sp. NPDC097224]|uniref:hypothetical protein n=1 Tax=Peribacillus sp. NPDC097224 TaxID=3364399 RepID=UPI00382F6616